MHVVAAKAVCFGEALRPDFTLYQRQTAANAATLAEVLMKAGFQLVTGGTDNHLILMDLRGREITGAEAERALGAAGIVVNKNSVPFDPRGPKVTSGVRIGAPAVTTRGMGPREMELVGDCIQKILNNPSDQKMIRRVRGAVSELCSAFPIYESLMER
jgi:glycine hydroxymethyltransferase